jgi:hypothetical protein
MCKVIKLLHQRKSNNEHPRDKPMSTGTWKKGATTRLHQREGVSLTESELAEWTNQRVLDALSNERARSIRERREAIKGELKRRGIKGYAKL